MLWGLLAFLRAADTLKDVRSAWQPGLKVGLIWLLTGLVQPLIGMVVGAVAGIYIIAVLLWQLWMSVSRPLLLQWDEFNKRLVLAIWAGSVALPWVLYNFFSLYLDPFLQRWTAQSSIPSPHPLHYLLAYGLMLIPGSIGSKYLLMDRPWIGWFVVGWVLSLPILAYAPYSLQRRLPDGVWIALIVLAMAGLEKFELQIKASSKERWIKLSLFLAFPSTLVLFFGACMALQKPSMPVFRPATEVDAFEQIADLSQTNQVVLATYTTSNALPAWAPVRVITGQAPESDELKAINRTCGSILPAENSGLNPLRFTERI